MKRILKICLVLFGIMPWCPCVHAQIAAETDSLIKNDSHFQELRIAPSYYIEATIEDVFDSVKYVFLETTKESEFSNISQLEVTKKHYIIFDHRLQTILFFFKDGRFDRKLSAPKDFERAKSFAIREADSTLIIDDLNSFYQYVFGIDGSFRKKEPKISAVDDIAYIDSFKIQYNGFGITTKVESEIPECYPNLVVRNERSKTEKQYLWFNPHKGLEDDIYSGKTFYRSGMRGTFLARELDNVVYRFDSDGIPKRQFKLVLPLENSLPLDFSVNPLYDNNRIEFLRKNSQISHRISDVYQVGDWLTLTFFPDRPFFYNLLTGEYFDFTKMTSNSTDLKAKAFGNAVLGVEDTAFITSINFLLLKHLYHNLDSKTQKEVGSELKKLMSRSYYNPILKVLYVKK